MEASESRGSGAKVLRHASYLNAGAITGILCVGDGVSAVLLID